MTFFEKFGRRKKTLFVDITKCSRNNSEFFDSKLFEFFSNNIFRIRCGVRGAGCGVCFVLGVGCVGCGVWGVGCVPHTLWV
jgi:hypothetical protein